MVIKNLPDNAGDTRDDDLIPGSGRSPRVGNRNPLQYSRLENSMDGGAWRATVPGVAKSRTRLSTHAHSTGQCKYINQKQEITILIGNKVGFRFKKEDKEENSIMLKKM